VHYEILQIDAKLINLVIQKGQRTPCWDRGREGRSGGREGRKGREEWRKEHKNEWM